MYIFFLNIETIYIIVIRILSIMSLKEIKYRNFKAKIIKLSKKQAKKDMIYGYYNPNESTIAIQRKFRKNFLC